MAENTEFLSTDMHIILDQFKLDAPIKKQMEYLKKFGRQASKEVPEEITVLMSGHTFDLQGNYLGDSGKSYVYSTKKLPMTVNALNQINNFSTNALCSRMFQTVVEQLLLDKGMTYFTEPKYLTIDTEFFCKVFMQEDGTLIQEEISIADIPLRAELISCFLHNGCAGYYIPEDEEE